MGGSVWVCGWLGGWVDVGVGVGVRVHIRNTICPPLQRASTSTESGASTSSESRG